MDLTVACWEKQHLEVSYLGKKWGVRPHCFVVSAEEAERKTVAGHRIDRQTKSGIYC